MFKTNKDVYLAWVFVSLAVLGGIILYAVTGLKPTPTVTYRRGVNGEYCSYADCTNEATVELYYTETEDRRIPYYGESDYYSLGITDHSGSTSEVTYATKKVVKYDPLLGGWVQEKVRVPNGVIENKYTIHRLQIGGFYCSEHNANNINAVIVYRMFIIFMKLFR
jgi:hypothetical protein